MHVRSNEVWIRFRFHYFISMAFQVLKKKLEKIIHQFKQIIYYIYMW